jgi:hypothetical protein
MAATATSLQERFHNNDCMNLFLRALRISARKFPSALLAQTRGRRRDFLITNSNLTLNH